MNSDNKFTEIYYKTLDSVRVNRITVSYGGSSSSKTISALQVFTSIAESSKQPLIFTIIAESIPVIKRTVLRDWKRIVMCDSFDGSRFNKVELTYQFTSGSLFQFVSADDPDRFRGMRQDFVLIDEASNVKQEVFDQVEIRTSKRIILTFNPSHEFWVTEVMARKDCYTIHSTYKDNPFVEQSIINSLEQRIETNPNFYRVYVLGEWGSLEGLVYDKFKIVDEMPKDYRMRFAGLDFGYTNDPTALIDICFADGELWANELIYETKLTNQDIGIKAKDYKMEVFADSAEPKSIEELRRMGMKIYPTVKGSDSIRSGIDLVKQYKLNVTKSSVNLIKELRNYRWEVKDSKPTNKPIDDFNHALDALRYGVMAKIQQKIKPGKWSN